LVVPFAIDGASGAMARPVTTAAVIDNVLVPVIRPEVAVMVTGPPTRTPVARPFERPAFEMLAVPEALEVHVTVLVRSC